MADEALMQQLRDDEGLRLKPYTDTAGKLTIGYGRNLIDVGISLDEAEMLLAHDVEAIKRGVLLRWAPFARLDDVRQGVILNIAFNVGVGGLMLFTHMLAACAQGDYERAAAEIRNSHLAPLRAVRLAKQMQNGLP